MLRIVQPTESIEVTRLCVLGYGQPGCLAGDTWIPFHIRTQEGKPQNHKGGTLEWLYRRFHLLKRPGLGAYQRASTVESTYHVPSMTDEGKIFVNLVADVIDSGCQTVWRVTTERGFTVKATIDHPFAVPTGGYRPLAELRCGDPILCHPRIIRGQGGKRKPPRRPGTTVKYHPSLPSRLINGYVYHWLPLHMAAYEAKQNGMELDTYLAMLKQGDTEAIDKLWTIPDGMDIHHLDENYLNNDPSNLVLTDHAEHQAKYHRSSSTDKVTFYAEPDPIIAIDRVGMEQVYDITMTGPWHNFVAGGLVVHNSRKSSLAQTANSPFTVATDPGIYRAYGRKACALVDTWADVLEACGTPECAAAKTVVCDTVGMTLEKLGHALVEESPKNGNRLGGLSLAGYGVLKTRFAAWVSGIRERGQDLVFLAHEKAERNGDETYYCPDITGGSYNTLMNHCDLVGYLHFANGKRCIDFSPTDRWMAKAPPCGWESIPLPDFAVVPDFLAKLLAEAKASMGQVSAQSAEVSGIVAEWDNWIAQGPTLAEFNERLPEVARLKNGIKAQVWKLWSDYAVLAGWTLPKGARAFVVKEAS